MYRGTEAGVGVTEEGQTKRSEGQGHRREVGTAGLFCQLPKKRAYRGAPAQPSLALKRHKPQGKSTPGILETQRGTIRGEEGKFQKF